MEHFVVAWILEIIGHKIDFRQYGGMKGNSISHYLIELINFILFNQDKNRCHCLPRGLQQGLQQAGPQHIDYQAE